MYGYLCKSAKYWIKFKYRNLAVFCVCTFLRLIVSEFLSNASAVGKSANQVFLWENVCKESHTLLEDLGPKERRVPKNLNNNLRFTITTLLNGSILHLIFY